MASATCAFKFKKPPLIFKKEYQNSVVKFCASISKEAIKKKNWTKTQAHMWTLDFKTTAEVEVKMQK